jgi:superfamily II DNA or RNA helicase
MAEKQKRTLSYERGTLVLSGVPRTANDFGVKGLVWDYRIGAYRAAANRYAALRRILARMDPPIDDLVAQQFIHLRSFETIELRPYQEQALESWWQKRCRGIVVLPTGAGKSWVALAAMARLKLATLILVPTLVLVAQWVDLLRRVYAGEIGVFGEGQRTLAPVTVATFESAYRKMEQFGSQFQLLVVDEVHHFASGLRCEALEECCAPARLGLTATMPTDIDACRRLETLVGRLTFRQSVVSLAGRYLAPFEIVRHRLPLTIEEWRSYDQANGVFLTAFEEFRGNTRSTNYQLFVKDASQTAAGRRALAAFRKSRRIVSCARNKMDFVAQLLNRHREDQLLIFTSDNHAAYGLSRRLLVPALTCDIGRNERQEVLDRFGRGELRAIISARVLNEGVDVPQANVGIIVGGARGGREHVQRVGRLLRPMPGKRAVVYELVAKDTHEERLSANRERSLAS